MLSVDDTVKCQFSHIIGHEDMKTFPFERSDETWVLSYSRIQLENEVLLDTLCKAEVSKVIYFSSATTNICTVTTCYEYPRVKAAAASYAKSRLNAVIVLLGLVYETNDELPSGMTAAVSLDDLKSFFLSFPPVEAGQDIKLFSMIYVPFKSNIERLLHYSYDFAQNFVGRKPCILRPLDFALRAVGYKWYGYVNMSNRLWISTIS